MSPSSTPTRAIVALAAAASLVEILCIAAPAHAGDACTPAPGDHSFEMERDGVTRTFDVHVPPSCDPATPIPLVFDFHGLGSTKGAQASVSGFKAKADEEGFIVVHPQGYGRAWNAGWCCSRFGTPQHFLDDVGFVRAILDELSKSLPIDPTRVHATGISNGGAMTHWLACTSADWIAAAAPVAYHLSIRDACSPSRAIPVLQIHATGDQTVPYEMLPQPTAPWPSAPDSILRWSQLNGCEETTERTVDLDDAYCDEHPSCDEGATAALCTVVGGAHVTYPYATAAGIRVPDIVWDFFQNQTLAVPEPGSLALQTAALATLGGLGRGRRHRRDTR